MSISKKYKFETGQLYCLVATLQIKFHQKLSPLTMKFVNLSQRLNMFLPVEHTISSLFIEESENATGIISKSQCDNRMVARTF
jgi:hypothetical protein